MLKGVILYVVVPDLDSLVRPRKGGRVPSSAVDLAAQYCMRYIRSRCHDDLDKVSAFSTLCMTSTTEICRCVVDQFCRTAG